MNMDELREGIDLGRAVIEDNLMDMYITKKLLANEGFPEEDLDGFIAQKVREYEERYAAMEDEEFMASLTEEWERPAEDPDGTEDLTGCEGAEGPAEHDDAEAAKVAARTANEDPATAATAARMTTADPTAAKAREMEEELTRLAYIEDPEDPEFVEINPIAILQGLINVMDLQIGKVIRVKRALALAGVDPEEVAMAIADTAKEFDERYMKMSVTEIEETMFRRMAEIDEIVRSHPKG
ncbi:MAG: hypothetical protein IKI86_05985 [Firmicutes bacterium]|nr:hypothetical protein [Bacillota bacterium]MBR4024812.1 hypothetical protein [Bacillota bacterium]